MRLIRSFTARWRVPATLARLQKHGLSPAVLDALGNYIVTAADRELYHVNPRYLADRLGLDEPMTLQLIIATAAEGAFSLGWQTNCPVRVVLAAGSLPGVPGQVGLCRLIPARLESSPP